MQEFIATYKSQIIFLSIVVISYVILMWLTRFLTSLVRKRLERKYNLNNSKTIKLLFKMLTILWTILALMSISYVFLNDKLRALAKDNFFLILYIGIVAVLTHGLGALTQLFFNRQIEEKRHDREDATNFIFLKYTIVVSIYIIGLLLVVVAFPRLRGLAQTALGGAGILAVVIGIASQEALGNIVSGMFIITFKPFKIGDIIKISEELMGTVHNITLRHTVIKDFQNKMIVIPNSIINKEKVTNYNMEGQKICQWLIIGISYDSDIDLVKKIIKEECENHPSLIDNRTFFEKQNGVEKVQVRVVNLGDSSVDIKVWAWAKTFSEAFTMKTDLLESIKKRFDKEGVEIPYPHRTLVYKEAPSNKDHTNERKTFKNPKKDR